MRYIFEGGFEEEMGLTLLEHKLCVRHSGGPYAPIHLLTTRGGGWIYPPILQLRTLKLRESRKHGQGHTASGVEMECLPICFMPGFMFCVFFFFLDILFHFPGESVLGGFTWYPLPRCKIRECMSRK